MVKHRDRLPVGNSGDLFPFNWVHVMITLNYRDVWSEACLGIKAEHFQKSFIEL